MGHPPYQISNVATTTSEPPVNTPIHGLGFPMSLRSVFSIGSLRSATGLSFSLLISVIIILFPNQANCSIYDFIKMTTPGSFFAVDPDSVIRSMDPTADSRTWRIGETWGIPPLFRRSRVPGIYERLDILYPLAFKEDSNFHKKIKIIPVFESRWSKIPPFDYYTRFVTMFKGRSDMGQDYCGFFPFYGYSYRRFGVDRNFFFLFPLYYESEDDGARTQRILWPIMTYANDQCRSTLKVWPLFGRDRIRNDYNNMFLLWPFFQIIDKYMGQEQRSSLKALPFPLYLSRETNYDYNLDLLWPLFSYYKHYASGHQRYSFRPFFSYGYGGGVEEFSFLIYSSKKDRNSGKSSKSTDGYISLGTDEVVTEQKFMFMSAIQKRYRKGLLVYTKYRFWPFAEYIWDLDKGSHWKIPEIIPVKNDWWDLNLGRFLRIVDLRDTPITRELSYLFGLGRKNEVKNHLNIPAPPKSGDDNWSELIMGSFRKN